jgi:hypothetical protein
MQRKVFEFWHRASGRLPSTGATGRTLPASHIWMSFRTRPGCSVGPVATRTKDETHTSVLVQREVHCTYPSFLMSYCHATTAQYNGEVTTVCWVLAVVRQRAAFALRVLYVTSCDPCPSYRVINVPTPFHSYVQIPSTEFFVLYLRSILSFQLLLSFISSTPV